MSQKELNKAASSVDTKATEYRLPSGTTSEQVRALVLLLPTNEGYRYVRPTTGTAQWLCMEWAGSNLNGCTW